MEKLICFQITNTREIERLASNMKIRVIKADASIYNETLDNIVNGKISSVNSTFSASISPLVTENKLPADSILIFCDLSEKHLNRMLFELKSRKVQIDLKAILTPCEARLLRSSSTSSGRLNTGTMMEYFIL